MEQTRLHIVPSTAADSGVLACTGLVDNLLKPGSTTDVVKILLSLTPRPCLKEAYSGAECHGGGGGGGGS